MYILFTENVNRARIHAILSSHFDGWTAYEAIGAWQGIEEHSLVVMLLTEDYQSVLACAEEIRAANNQQAVAVTYVADSTDLVTAGSIAALQASRASRIPQPVESFSHVG